MDLLVVLAIANVIMIISAFALLALINKGLARAEDTYAAQVKMAENLRDQGRHLEAKAVILEEFARTFQETRRATAKPLTLAERRRG